MTLDSIKLGNIILVAPALLLSGCASTPPFSCDDMGARLEQEQKKARQAANDYHIAEGQKDAGYYGVKTARTVTCIGSLSLLCGVADGIASDNTRIEKKSEIAQERYEKTAKIAAGIRNKMEQHGCDNISPPLE